MKTGKHWLIALLMLNTFVVAAAEHLVLAVPARHDLINLGFDLVGMFPHALTLVCHSESPAGTRLEQFNTAAGRWVEMPGNAWSSMGCDKLVVVGSDERATQLMKAAGAARQATLPNGFRLHEVANAVTSTLKPSSGQWRRLADSHGFTLAEVNAEQRRYGRYGPPGGCRNARPLPAAAATPPPRPMAQRTTMTLEPHAGTSIGCTFLESEAVAAPVATESVLVVAAPVAVAVEEPIVPAEVEAEFRPEDK